MRPAYPAGPYRPFPRFSKKTHTNIAPIVTRTIARPFAACDEWACTEIAVVIIGASPSGCYTKDSTATHRIWVICQNDFDAADSVGKLLASRCAGSEQT